MAVVTTVRFAHDRGALAYTLHELPDANIQVLRDAGTDPEHDRSVFMFANANTNALAETLAADHTVEGTHRLPDYQGTEVYAVEFAEDTQLLAPTVTAVGGFSLEARRSEPSTGVVGWWERWLLPHRESLNEVWEYAREQGFTFEIQTISDFHPEASGRSGGLTSEQRRTLAVAYKAGYFDEPRGTSLESLAEELDLSSTAVGGRIRRGIRGLVEATVVEEADTHVEDKN